MNWIETGDKLPQKTDDYLCVDDHGCMIVLPYIMGKGWDLSITDDWEDVSEITHWMELPKPPNHFSYAQDTTESL